MVEPARQVCVVGLGAVGARVARSLHTRMGPAALTLVDRAETAVRNIQRTLGDDLDVRIGHAVPAGSRVVVLATPAGTHPRLARQALDHGVDVVSVGDSVHAVRGLLGLDEAARRAGSTVVVGAGFAPGLSCVLAGVGASGFDTVSEIHVTKFGTGGPACARQRHRALREEAIDWRDGWTTRRGGSGRELVYFPDPVDGHDAYRAAQPDALLLRPGFEGVSRITSRRTATRRDRLTMRLPMLRRPHPEGREGAIRVEVRGLRDGAQEVDVLGAVERPAVGAAAMATTTTTWLLDGRPCPKGAAGLIDWGASHALARDVLCHGVRLTRFEGR